MHCVQDEFRPADRDLLADRQGMEQPRQIEAITTVAEGVIVKASQRRECFTFHAPEVGWFRFDVRSIKDAMCWPYPETYSAAEIAAVMRCYGTVQRLLSRRTIS